MGVKYVALGLREGVFLSGVVPFGGLSLVLMLPGWKMWAWYLCGKGTSRWNCQGRSLCLSWSHWGQVSS